MAAIQTKRKRRDTMRRHKKSEHGDNLVTKLLSTLATEYAPAPKKRPAKVSVFHDIRHFADRIAKKEKTEDSAPAAKKRKTVPKKKTDGEPIEPSSEGSADDADADDE
jgi:hypothetical protein